MKLIDCWLDYLTKNYVRFSHSIHPRAETALETAEADRMPAHDLAKTVVYYGDNGFGMAVVPADEILDLAKLVKLLHASHIRLANETELRNLFPACELGAMPPFGKRYQMPVIVDRGVAGRDFIAFALGTHQDTVRMSFADFERLANPVIASIAAPYEALVLSK
jgi:Ala-tRNA(Pro) deacylase